MANIDGIMLFRIMSFRETQLWLMLMGLCRSGLCHSIHCWCVIFSHLPGGLRDTIDILTTQNSIPFFSRILGSSGCHLLFLSLQPTCIENEMKIGEKITYFIYCVFSPYNMPAFPKVYLQQMLSYFEKFRLSACQMKL